MQQLPTTNGAPGEIISNRQTYVCKILIRSAVVREFPLAEFTLQILTLMRNELIRPPRARFNNLFRH